MSTYNFHNFVNIFLQALNLFNLGIKNVCELLDAKKDEEAVKLYIDMTNLLIKGYGLDTKENQAMVDQYISQMDVKNSGHGKVAVLK